MRPAILTDDQQDALQDLFHSSARVIGSPPNRLRRAQGRLQEQPSAFPCSAHAKASPIRQDQRLSGVFVSLFVPACHAVAVRRRKQWRRRITSNTSGPAATSRWFEPRIPHGFVPSA
jgi:hypothetical protein